MSDYKVNIFSHVMVYITILPLMFTCIEGCVKSEKKIKEGEQAELIKVADFMKMPSANYYLTLGDLKYFQPGRIKDDILNDIQWRGKFWIACKHEDKTICAILFFIIPDDPNITDDGELVWAVFIDNKFEKFVSGGWGESEKVPYRGTTRTRPKPIKLGEGDLSLLIQLMNREPLNLSDLEKKVKAIKAPPSQVDPGLTIAYLLLKSQGLTPKSANENDYKKNAELRDQFNASRLKIGMTEAEVEKVLKAKPFEIGKVDAGTYEIYGSNESFNINAALLFSNILILFKEGKACIIYGTDPGDSWRHNLSERFSNLVEPKK
jgi:hypothetical protein